MAEYIEREAALNICQKEYEERLKMHDYCGDSVAWNIGGAIKGLPAADVAPVMHGQWIGVDSSFWKSRHDTDIPVFRKTYRCPFCARRTAIMENYCPNCGAKMDGGRGNG